MKLCIPLLSSAQVVHFGLETSWKIRKKWVEPLEKNSSAKAQELNKYPLVHVYQPTPHWPRPRPGRRQSLHLQLCHCKTARNAASQIRKLHQKLILWVRGTLKDLVCQSAGARVEEGSGERSETEKSNCSVTSLQMRSLTVKFPR